MKIKVELWHGGIASYECRDLKVCFAILIRSFHQRFKRISVEWL